MHGLVPVESFVGLKYSELQAKASAKGYKLECVPVDYYHVGRYRVYVAPADSNDAVIAKTLYNVPQGHNLSEAYRILKDIEMLMNRLPEIEDLPVVKAAKALPPMIAPRSRNISGVKKQLADDIYGHEVAFLKYQGRYIVHCRGLHVPCHYFDMEDKDEAEKYAREYVCDHLILAPPPLALMWERDVKPDEYLLSLSGITFYLRRQQKAPYGKWWLTCDDKAFMSQKEIYGHEGQATYEASEIIRKAFDDCAVRMLRYAAVMEKALDIQRKERKGYDSNHTTDTSVPSDNILANVASTDVCMASSGDAVQ